MDNPDFDKLAAKTQISFHSLEIVRALLVGGRNGLQVARDFNISHQRIYQLKKEFLEQAGYTPLQRLYHEIAPLMAQLGITPRHARAIRAFIRRLR